MTQPVQTPEWVKDAVFYQVFPDRFARSDRVEKPANLESWDSPPTSHGFKGGDLLGVAEHLDYLQDLGITAIYLNPVFQSASNHRYHTHDYYHVDPLLGGNAALRTLLDAARARGMRVVLDGVFNHASRGFFQFNHILECGAQSPYLDWFTVNGFPLHAYDEEQPPNYDAWIGLRALPKLNTDNPQVRAFIFDVAEHWIAFGADGWRLDVPAEIDDDAFWQEFRRRVKGVNPDAYVVGEIWVEARRWLRGDQFDAVMNYIQTHAALRFFAARTLAPMWLGGTYPPPKPLKAPGFARAIEDMLALYDWSITTAQLNLLSSHDMPRFVTLAGGDQSALRLAMLFQMTMPGAPTVYYGDEIGLSGGYDPECRGPMPWDEQRWDAALRDYVRATIRLRHAHPALRRGTYRALLAKGELFAFERDYQGERLLVAFNTAQDESTLHLPVNPAPRLAEFAFGEGRVAVEGGKVAVTLPGRSGAVLRVQ